MTNPPGLTELMTIIIPGHVTQRHSHKRASFRQRRRAPPRQSRRSRHPAPGHILHAAARLGQPHPAWPSARRGGSLRRLGPSAADADGQQPAHALGLRAVPGLRPRRAQRLRRAGVGQQERAAAGGAAGGGDLVAQEGADARPRRTDGLRFPDAKPRVEEIACVDRPDVQGHRGGGGGRRESGTTSTACVNAFAVR